MIWVHHVVTSGHLPPGISLRHPTEEKMLDFRELEPGWCYGEGQRPSSTILKYAFELYREARRYGFEETDAFPGVDGEIRFTIYQGQHYLEFTVEIDGSVSYCRENGETEVACVERLGVDDARDIIRRFWREIWKSSESSIVDGTTSGREDFRVSPFRIAAGAGGVSPSLIGHVSPPPGTASAIIFDNFIVVQPTSPQYSGVLAPIRFS